MRYAFSDCLLDTETLSLTRNGAAVAVEPQVFDLIRLLVDNAGRVVTRDEIVDAVWQGRIVSESAISARIAAARKALGDDGKRQAVIRTVARRGLQMVPEVTTDAAKAPSAPPAIDLQRIRYLRLPSGHAMAYAVSGDGPPVVLAGNGQTDLELEARLSSERIRFEALSRRNTLIRFDPVGTGQSERSLDRVGAESEAEDMGHLADALGLDSFAITSNSGGCQTALHYAARSPGRVTRLAMTGGYVDGRTLRNDTETAEPLRAMIQAGWSHPENAFVHAFLVSYLPEGPEDSVRAYANMMQASCDPEYALLNRDKTNAHSCADDLDRIACPTLIFHARRDAVHPLTEARKLASGIAGAELVLLESANHIPMPGNAIWEDYIRMLTDFLAG